MELALYREYRDVVGIFKYVVETDRRFYLCNAVDVKVRSETGDAYFEVTLTDAWVWDIYRPARFAKNVKVLTFKDVNVEELQDSDVKLPRPPDRHRAPVVARTMWLRSIPDAGLTPSNELGSNSSAPSNPACRRAPMASCSLSKCR